MSQHGDGTIIFKELCRELERYRFRKESDAMRECREGYIRDRAAELQMAQRNRADAMRRAGVALPVYPLTGMEEGEN